MADEDIETFLKFSARYSHIEALDRDWEDQFPAAVARLRVDSVKTGFRRGFAKSLCGQLTPRTYEHRTGWDFDTDEEFHQHLLNLWHKFYGDADPRNDLA